MVEAWLKQRDILRCKVCKDKKNKGVLGTMGVSAVNRHAEADTHKDNYDAYLASLAFFEPRNQPASNQQAHPNSDVPSTSNNVVAIQDEEEPCPDPIPSIVNHPSKTQAEIIWSLHCLKQGYSDNSMKGFCQVLLLSERKH